MYAHTKIWDSSVSIVTSLWAGWPGFNAQQWQEFFHFTTSSRPALGPTQSPIQWVLGALSTGFEADHSPPSRAVVKNGGSYISTPLINFHGMVTWCLGKHRICLYSVVLSFAQGQLHLISCSRSTSARIEGTELPQERENFLKCNIWHIVYQWTSVTQLFFCTVKCQTCEVSFVS
jgi:hypothetical protein